MQSKRETQHSSHAKKRNATRTTTGAIGDGSFLSSPGEVKAVVTVKKNDRLFSQGNPGDTVFYIQKGQVKLTVISQSGKEATVALLGPGDFVGQECLAADQTVRLVTAIPKISQETMATMIGTTRGRVNYFLNRFRKLGFIRYNGGVEVNSSLLNVVLND